MEIAVISFTRPGKALAEKIADALSRGGNVCRFTGFAGVAELFTQVRGIIFVGATGIAVRAIAPHIRSKYTDPAVVVCDEQGIHAISLLSGHEGGANELTRTVAKIIGAAPVITTASELRTLVAGCGCRRGVSAERIEQAFLDAAAWPERFCKLCTADIKRDEPGLLEFAEKFSIPLEFYSSDELNAAVGTFHGSDFVKGVTGADNVCERAAVLGGGVKPLVPKFISDGVTVAVYELEKFDG